METNAFYPDIVQYFYVIRFPETISHQGLSVSELMQHYGTIDTTLLVVGGII